MYNKRITAGFCFLEVLNILFLWTRSKRLPWNSVVIFFIITFEASNYSFSFRSKIYEQQIHILNCKWSLKLFLFWTSIFTSHSFEMEGGKKNFLRRVKHTKAYSCLLCLSKSIIFCQLLRLLLFQRSKCQQDGIQLMIYLTDFRKVLIISLIHLERWRK